MALHNAAIYTNAFEGDGKVKGMYLPHEIDGITNGTSIALSQLPFNVEEAKDILRSTGVFFKGDKWKTAKEYFADGHQDMYKKLASVTSSLLDLANIQGLDSNGNNIVSFNIEGFADMNNIIMPKMLNSDKTVSSQGRDFTKQFLMTYIYSKGDKARIQDMKDIAINNLYSTLGELQTRIDEVLADTDIFSKTASKDYTDLKDEVQDINNSIRRLHKDALTNRSKLINAVNKLIVQARGAKSKSNRIAFLANAKKLMEDSSYLLPNGSYNYTGKNKEENNSRIHLLS